MDENKIKLLNKWDSNKEKEEQKFITHSVRIIVQTEEDRQQILLALEYIHGLFSLDTDYMAVNYLVHLYEYPNQIEVS